MKSPGHRANILDENYTEAGFATAEGQLEGKPTTLVVAVYGKPKTTTTAVAGAKSQEINSQAATKPSVSQNLAMLSRLNIATQTVTPVFIGSSILILNVSFSRICDAVLPQGTAARATQNLVSPQRHNKAEQPRAVICLSQSGSKITRNKRFILESYTTFDINLGFFAVKQTVYAKISME
jgi:hypothetical protein